MRPGKTGPFLSAGRKTCTVGCFRVTCCPTHGGNMPPNHTRRRLPQHTDMNSPKPEALWRQRELHLLQLEGPLTNTSPAYHALAPLPPNLHVLSKQKPEQQSLALWQYLPFSSFKSVQPVVQSGCGQSTRQSFAGQALAAGCPPAQHLHWLLKVLCFLTCCRQHRVFRELATAASIPQPQPCPTSRGLPPPLPRPLPL